MIKINFKEKGIDANLYIFHAKQSDTKDRVDPRADSANNGPNELDKKITKIGKIMIHIDAGISL